MGPRTRRRAGCRNRYRGSGRAIFKGAAHDGRSMGGAGMAAQARNARVHAQGGSGQPFCIAEPPLSHTVSLHVSGTISGRRQPPAMPQGAPAEGAPLQHRHHSFFNVCARLIYALFQIPKFAFSEMWSDLFRAQQGTTEPARGRRQVFGVSASVPHRIGGA